MKKILSLTTTYPTFLPGDATPPFVHELNKRLAKEGLEIYVLAPRRPGAKLYEEQDGVKVYRYPYFFFSKWEKLADGGIMPNIKKNKWLVFQIPLLLSMCFFYTIWMVSKFNLKVIHAHRIFMNGFVGALYKKFINKNIKLICTSHGSDLHTLGGGVVDKLKRRTIKQCDEVTVVSNYLKKNLDTLMGYKTNPHIVSMGVDETKFNPSNYDENIKKQYGISGKFLLFVGRLAPEKGVEDLIRAMPKVVEEMPDVKLLIIGHGPLQNPLKQITLDLGLNNNIIFAGAIPNHELPKYYATADLLVAPSIKESFGLVQVEAIMSGTPVITTAGLGSEDIIIDSVNGTLTHKLNEIPVKIIERLKVSNEENKEKMKKSIIEKFSRIKITSMFLDIIN